MAVYLIEFIGGPLDGHRQQISIPPDDLEAYVTMPVGRNVFRLMEGQPPARKDPVTSVAFYEREIAGGVIRYRFVVSRSPAQVPMER